MNLFIEKLKNKVLESYSEGASDTVIVNIIKEECQYAILDFLYNNEPYSHLIMYGGTLLRIAYGLPRMSEDLDFQTHEKFDFKKFEKDLAAHFKSVYSVDLELKPKTERLTGTDMAFINFPNILEDIGIKKHKFPTILKIRFDVNYFSALADFDLEAIPISKDNYAFSIMTYPISTLMASKVAAVLLRIQKRGIGKGFAYCKPRDIYDLIWYMKRKVIPDINYLKAIHSRVKMDIKANNILEVFDLIAEHVAKLDDTLFRQDLTQFFYNLDEYEDWHRTWRQQFIALRNSYGINKVKKLGEKPDLKEIYISQQYDTQNQYFHFSAENAPMETVKFTFILSEYWYRFPDLRIDSGHKREEIHDKIFSKQKLTELDYEYLGLFYSKIEDYLIRNDYILLQAELKTKVIRSTADNLNVKTQVFLDKKLLVKARLEDLI